MEMPRFSQRRRVLFLCTGNYYRSRYAEELFNHVAARAALDWHATSRGLAVERLKSNVGRVSRTTLAALILDGVYPAGARRIPLPCTREDLQAAEIIIAIRAAEHRPLLVERFPGWHKRVVYWNVHDIEKADPSETLCALKHLVTQLADKLAEEARETLLTRNAVMAYSREKSGAAKERAMDRLFQSNDLAAVRDDAYGVEKPSALVPSLAEAEERKRVQRIPSSRRTLERKRSSPYRPSASHSRSSVGSPRMPLEQRADL